MREKITKGYWQIQNLLIPITDTGFDYLYYLDGSYYDTNGAKKLILTNYQQGIFWEDTCGKQHKLPRIKYDLYISPLPVCRKQNNHNEIYSFNFHYVENNRDDCTIYLGLPLQNNRWFDVYNIELLINEFWYSRFVLDFSPIRFYLQLWNSSVEIFGENTLAWERSHYK